MLLADQLGLGEKESEHAQPLLALRPKGAQIAVTGKQLDVVEVRAGSSGPAREVTLEPSLQILRARRLRLVARACTWEPELVRPLCEVRLQERNRLATTCDDLSGKF